MNYIPGSGSKKPLNQIEGPIYPDIKKGPMRFAWSRKHWNVDVGRTLMETEHRPSFATSSVLYQSRDYNKTIYGQPSHRDYVNHHFRPPLRALEDNVPLSRLPRFPTTPRINPDTVGMNPTFATQNERPNEIFAKLTDRVKKGDMRPTFYMPFDLPQDNSVLPDLERKVPQYSATAGIQVPFMFDVPMPQDGYPKLEDAKPQPLIDTGFYVPTDVQYIDNLDYDLTHNRPTVQADAGINIGMDITHISDTNVVPKIREDHKYSSASSGYHTQFSNQLTPIEYTLKDKLPTISVCSGVTSFESPTPDIQGFMGKTQSTTNLPSGSISSGTGSIPTFTSVQEPSETRVSSYPKLPSDGTYRLNPSGGAYNTDNNKNIYCKDLRDSHPSYSYEVPMEYPVKDELNNMYTVPYHEKQSSLGTYYPIGTNPYVPKKNQESKPVVLKDIIGIRKKF